jgi:phosphoglycolate phosphatase
VLILLDIDGTLLHGSPRAHTEALVGAMAEVHGMPVGIEDVAAIRPGGRTDPEIVRLVLSAAGMSRREIDRGMAAVAASAAFRYPAAQAGSPPRAAPDAAPALERLARAGVTLALLTGNLEPIARAKMAHVGLARFFPPDEGAFGSDHERRDALVPVAIARARAAFRCAEPAVVVGDTPRDVLCARAGGARCVAVTTGSHAADELRDADAVVGGLSTAADVILAWGADGYPSSSRRTRS